MQQKRYEVSISYNPFIARFKSKGTNGTTIKVISFQKLPLPNVYSLAFGDQSADGEDFDDKSVTDNGDTQTVLATVAYAVEISTKRNPDFWVFAKGNTAARNRLYQIGINK